MKLLRVGEVGHEKIAALDKTNVIRDLSDKIDNLSSNTFNTQYLEKIKKIDLSKQKEISSRTRIGPFINNSKIIVRSSHVYMIFTQFVFPYL